MSRAFLLPSLALAPALLLAGACAAPPEAGGAPLRVASDLDNPPFTWVDDESRPAGRDVEMMRALAAKLGRELAWVQMPFGEVLDAVEGGEVDLACATLGITPARSQRVLFTEPYFDTAIAVVVRRGDGEPLGLRELDGRRVYAGRGTTSERAVERELPEADLVLESKDDRTVAERLLAGSLDAAVMDGPVAERMVASHPDRLLRIENLVPERYALAVRPGLPELRAELDRALAEMARAGRLSRLDVRYELKAIPQGDQSEVSEASAPPLPRG